MSIKYFVCSQCNEIGDDHTEGWDCCDCGNHYCSSDCAEEAKVIDQENGDETGIYSMCGYCRGELFTDKELLKIALDKLGMSRKELIANLN
jgi:hypothetical protein